MSRAEDAEFVKRALEGQEPELTQLIKRLTPVIQVRVARKLLDWKTKNSIRRPVSDLVEDYAQDIWLLLLRNNGHLLRKWSPEGGASLENYVGNIAGLRTISALRVDKRNPVKEEPSLPEELDSISLAPNPEAYTLSEDTRSKLLKRLREELSDSSWSLFELLYLHDLEVKEVSEITGHPRSYLYTWMSRLRKLVRRVLDEIEGE